MKMIVEAIKKAVEKVDLSREEAGLTMEEIMDGQATPAQIAALITALRMKGETVDEITGFAETMRAFATRIFPKTKDVVDTCGTGGDRTNTFNISTTAAFVVAGAGVPVAKHGNRSVSSQCGSADVLEVLGVKLDIEPEKVAACIDEVGIGFLFAPLFHSAMGHAAAPRREISIRTIFNILGPLTNPAGASAQVLGVYDPALCEVMAKVLKKLGIRQALVVHGAGGLDEVSVVGETMIAELRDGQVIDYAVDPENLGIKPARLEELQGGTKEENASILRSVLSGSKGTRRDVVLLNAAAALVASSKASDLKEGIAIAAQSIDSGAALKKLEALIEFTNGKDSKK